MTMTSADLEGEDVPDRQPRVYTTEYKLRIVAEYDAATEHGARGALLRREGLYQSHVKKWRTARDEGRLAGGGQARRTRSVSATERENARLRAQVEALSAELDSTKAVLDIMGKASGLLHAISSAQEPPRPSQSS